MASAGPIDLSTALSGTGFARTAGYTVPQLVYMSFEVIFMGAAITSFFYLLIGSVQWISSSGEKEGIEKSRKKITASLVGLSLVLSVYAIYTIVDIIFFGGNNTLFDLKIPKI